MMKRLRLVSACLLLLSAPSWAESRFVLDPEPPGPTDIDPGKPWQEERTPLPPWPKDADLIEFELDGTADGFRYFIDGGHLDIGKDQVVRYTLVAKGRGGARNLSREGIRCTPKGRYKILAYGSDGVFSRVDGTWQTLDSPDAAPYRQDLWRYHFCVPRGFRPRPKKDMIRSLKGRISPSQNSGFLTD